jgi:hypothetical protein
MYTFVDLTFLLPKYVAVSVFKTWDRKKGGPEFAPPPPPASCSVPLYVKSHTQKNVNRKGRETAIIDVSADGIWSHFHQQRV